MKGNYTFLSFILFCVFIGVTGFIQGCTSGNSEGAGFFTPSPSPTATATPQDSGSVTGKVTNSTGGAVAGVKVCIGDNSATTGPDGSYLLENIPAGTNAIVGQCNGYQNYVGSVTVISNSSVIHDIVISAIPADTGTVSGTITDSVTSTPIVGVVVLIGELASVTDSNGEYTINGNTAQKEGYTNYSGTVNVTAGATTTHDFTMTPATGTVTRTVTDNSGTPLSGVKVYIGSITDTTGASGAYTLSGIPAGDNIINAFELDYGDYFTCVSIAAGDTLTHNISMLSRSWRYLGSPGFSAGVIDWPCLYVYDGTPYVLYRDGANDDKATMMKYDTP